MRKAYDSAKEYFSSVLYPLAQAGILLSEAMERSVKGFPETYITQVDSGDLKQAELEAKNRQINSMLLQAENIRNNLISPDPTLDVMKTSQLTANTALINLYRVIKKDLETKLQKLLAFHASSPSIFSEITSIGTFTIPNQEVLSWTKGIQEKWWDYVERHEPQKIDGVPNKISNVEEGEMCGPSSSEKEGFDGKKLARDIAGEISGEYDVRRAWDGIDPSTGEKLSTWGRFSAGGMAIAGLTPVGKISKVGKGVKMTANAVDAVNTAKKVEHASDISAISKNTGWSYKRIQRIKEHVFLKDHQLPDRVGKFDPDFGIARAWQRLEQGVHHENDIKLLKHEYFESRFEGIFKVDYATAHAKTVESGRPWGAPDSEPFNPLDEHFKIPLDKAFD